MDIDRLRDKLKHFTPKKIADETGLDYFVVRNFLIGRTRRPEKAQLMEDWCQSKGAELTKKTYGNPGALREKLNNFEMKRVSTDTGVHYRTVWTFMAGYVAYPKEETMNKLEDYAHTVGLELKRRCS